MIDKLYKKEYCFNQSNETNKKKWSKKKMSNLKKTLVYSILERKEIFALRQSNQTLLVPFSLKLANSDRAILIDKYGHRYTRDISFEQSSSHMVFTMI